MSDEKERVRAMTLGQSDWGTHGSTDQYRRYIRPIPPRSRRRCSCGCGTRSTHVGCTNGLAMTSGCELSMRRWTR